MKNNARLSLLVALTVLLTSLSCDDDGDSATEEGLPTGAALIAMNSVATAFNEVGTAVVTDQGLSKTAAREEVTISVTVESSFGGSATFDGTIDLDAGLYSATIDFNNWTSSGGTTIDGTGDYNVSFASLTNFSGSYAGDFTVTYLGSTYDIELDYEYSITVSDSSVETIYAGSATINGTTYSFDETVSISI